MWEGGDWELMVQRNSHRTLFKVYVIYYLQDLLLEIRDMLRTVVSQLKQGNGVVTGAASACKKEEVGDAYIVSIPIIRLSIFCNLIGQSLACNYYIMMY